MLKATDLSDTSSDLLRQLRETGNERAWLRFTQKYALFIGARCAAHGLQAADCDDVTQLVLVRLVRAMRRFVYDPSGSFRSWLWRLTDRLVLDFLRRRRDAGTQGTGGSAARKFLEQVPDPSGGKTLLRDIEEPSEPLRAEALQIQADVRKAVKPDTWEAFWLTDVQGLSLKATAELLRMSVANVCVARRRVRVRLHQAGQALRRQPPRAKGEAPDSSAPIG